MKYKISSLRTISVLELNRVVLGVYTNNLAAYNAVIARVPEQLRGKIVSYSTVHRKLVKAGDSIDVVTPLGIYVISKTLLLRKGA